MTTENPNSPLNPTPTPLTPPTPEKPLPIPSDPPLASPTEPTSLYPSEPAKTYSSDPSQYAYLSNENQQDLTHLTHLDEESPIHGSDVGPKPFEKKKQTKNFNQKKKSWNDSSNPRSKKIENIFEFSSNGRIQSLTYALLIISLILMFFNSLFGGLLIGLVAGYHFAAEIIYYIRHLDYLFSGQDHLRYITLTALLLGLFITAPGIFIGAAIAAAFKQAYHHKNDFNDHDSSGS